MATSSQSLARHIKRYLHAPTHEWFASCAPGFETVLQNELLSLGAVEPQLTMGGVSFQGKLELGYQANLWLRTANRVLLRIARFKAKRPEELFRQAHSLPWELLLSTHASLRIESSSTASWLSHSGLIAETLQDAIRRRLAETLPSEALLDDGTTEQLILVRLEEDEVVLSLDSSGEHLHRRGYRLASAKAPLRETLAAEMLMTAGYRGHMPLLDPMCGAGTFSIEAALLAANLPPGLQRDFTFMHWPSFKEATWQHLCKKAREGAARPEQPIVARDLHAGALNAIASNAERAGVSEFVQIEKADFFKAPPLESPGLVVLNPPYGERIGEKDTLARFYRKMGDRLHEAYQGWKFAILVPQPWLVSELHLSYDQRIRLPHGGLKVELLTGFIP